MDGLLTQSFLTALLTGVVTAGVPLLLAGLGEQISSPLSTPVRSAWASWPAESAAPWWR
jgi:hypothetical protein